MALRWGGRRSWRRRRFRPRVGLRRSTIEGVFGKLDLWDGVEAIEQLAALFDGVEGRFVGIPLKVNFNIALGVNREQLVLDSIVLKNGYERTRRCPFSPPDECVP